MSINFPMGHWCMPTPRELSGNCDMVAFALRRAFGLPVDAEFEWGLEGGRERLGFLCHAWAVMPDGRMLDADGPAAAPAEDPARRDPHDEWVRGFRIVRVEGRVLSYLTDLRETSARSPYGREMLESGTLLWVAEAFGPLLAGLGVGLRDDAQRLLKRHRRIRRRQLPSGSSPNGR